MENGCAPRAIARRVSVFGLMRGGMQAWILSLAASSAAPFPVTRDLVIQAPNLSVTPGSSGTFDVLLLNTNSSGGDSFNVAGDTIQLSLTGPLDVAFTDVTIGTTAAPYIYVTSGTGGGPLSFDIPEHAVHGLRLRVRQSGLQDVQSRRYVRPGSTSHTRWVRVRHRGPKPSGSTTLASHRLRAALSPQCSLLHRRERVAHRCGCRPRTVEHDHGRNGRAHRSGHAVHQALEVKPRPCPFVIPTATGPPLRRRCCWQAPFFSSLSVTNRAEFWAGSPRGLRGAGWGVLSQLGAASTADPDDSPRRCLYLTRASVRRRRIGGNSAS